MYCPGCGEIITDSAVFCENCGYDVRSSQKKKHSFRSILIILLVITLLLETCTLLYLEYFGPINVAPYITVSVLSADEKGTAHVIIDKPAIAQDAARRMRVRGTLNGKTLSSNSDEYKVLFDSFSVDVSPKDNLREGETLSIRIQPNNNMLKKYKISIRENRFSYTVTETDSYDTFDAFSDVTVKLTGSNGRGKVSIDTPKAKEKGLVYEVAPSDNLSNGDVVTISVKPEKHSDFAQYGEEYGQVPASAQKEYEVSELGEIVADIDEITNAKEFDTLFERVKSDYEAGVKKDWSDPSRYLGMTYEGGYLLTGKKGDESPANYYFLIYKISVRDAYTDVYRFARFENISKNSDGSLNVDVNNYSSPSGSKVGDSVTGDAIIIDTNNHYLVGFGSEYSLYDKYISPLYAKYDIEED